MATTESAMDADGEQSSHLQDDEDSFNAIHAHKVNPIHARISHERLCYMKEQIDSLFQKSNEGRTSSSPETGDDSEEGEEREDLGENAHQHAFNAIHHNLWVLATAATRQLKEVGERCDAAFAASSKANTPEPKEEKKKTKSVNASTSLSRPAIKERKERVKEKETVSESASVMTRSERATRATEKEKERVQAETPLLLPPPLHTSATLSAHSTLAQGIASGGEEEQTTTAQRTTKRKATTKERKEDESKRETRKDEREKEKTSTPNAAKKRQSSTRNSAKNGNAKKPFDEPTYCICKRVSFGDMIGCDNDKCEMEWFHFECVELKVKPKGKWFCPECRAPDNAKLPKSAATKTGKDATEKK